MSDGDRRSEKPYQERHRDGGRALDEIGLAMSGRRSLSVDVVGLAIRAPQVEGGDFLLTVKGVDSAGSWVVAFHGSPYLLDAICGLQNRLNNGSLKWRVDEFHGG